MNFPEESHLPQREPVEGSHVVGIEDKVFLLVLTIVSLAFALIIWPFFGAVLWAVVLAILFKPLYRKMLGLLRQKRSLSAVATVFIIVVIVLFPLAITVVALVNEVTQVYGRIQSGQLDFAGFFQGISNSMPGWVNDLLDRFGLRDLSALQARFSTSLAAVSKFVVTQAINLGQNTFSFVVSLFVMLYLLFFLLRDGDALYERIRETIPLRSAQKRSLLENFIVVIRATVKGSIVIALLQGALGGIMFWVLGIEAPLLWGVLMALFSLLPAVGAAMVWVPAVVYLFATGSVAKAGILLGYGILVISLVDNFVRPILVGKDTKLPDYLVLISTLGGISIFGVNGFVMGPVIAALFLATWTISARFRSETPASAKGH